MNNAESDVSLLLTIIGSTPGQSSRPLYLLYLCLKEFSWQWPASDLVRCYVRLSRRLNYGGQTEGHANIPWLLDATERLIKTSYTSLTDFLTNESKPALRTADGNALITHRGLLEFIKNFRLPVQGPGRTVVAVALSNGPMLAATCLATATYYTVAPINPAVGIGQFRADLTQAGATVIITTKECYAQLALAEEWVSRESIQVFFVDWPRGDDIQLFTTDALPVPQTVYRQANAAGDIAMILFTSGTSGTKKVVPFMMHSIVIGVLSVVDSWRLSPEDICLNMMPLYHV